ncbi:MAG: hypothetical protein ABI639_06455 [Thermoanaerobaculia bacterium]
MIAVRRSGTAILFALTSTLASIAPACAQTPLVSGISGRPGLPGAPAALATTAPGAEPPAAPGGVEVHLQPAGADGPEVGDPVTATLTLALSGADSAREATFPDWSKGWGEAEVLQASAVEKSSTPEGVLFTQRLTLAAFRPGSTALPPVEVHLSGEPPRHVTTPAALALVLRSVIPPDDKELKPAPPAPPRSLSVPRSFWWTLATGIALAFAAAILVWRRRATADPLAAPQLSPIAELERALGLLAVEAPAAGFRLLSHALRRYLGRKLSFRALESTTSEMQRRLAARHFEPVLVQRATRLLRLADQVKFALRPVEASELATRIAECRDLATTVETHLAPPVESQPVTAGVAGVAVAGVAAAPTGKNRGQSA